MIQKTPKTAASPVNYNIPENSRIARRQASQVAQKTILCPKAVYQASAHQPGHKQRYSWW